MTPEQFEEIFEKLKDQENFLPSLRSMILDLGTRGLLEEQTTELESAKELFQRIQSDRNKKQKIRSKKINEGMDEPFNLPSNWKWVRLGEVFINHGQKQPDNDFLYIDVSGINKAHGSIKELKKLAPGDAPSRARKIVKRGDVIYSCVRPNLLNIAVVNETVETELIASTAFAVLCGNGHILPNYTWMVLRSPYLTSIVDNLQRGQAYPAINDKDFYSLPFPLPPLEEQKRIVAKVDELMALCDELENTHKKTNRTKLTYLKSVTQHICDSAPGGDKQDSLSSAFERAPRNAEGIQELKKVCINFGIYMDQQSEEENGKFFDKMQEHTDKMKADKALPKSFSIQQSESELFSSIACLSLGSVTFIEKGKTGIKSAEPGEYPLVVTAAERQTCKSYDFETKAAIVPLVSSTGHGHASIQRLHYQSGKFALGTILAAIAPFDEGLFSSRFIYEYLNTFKEELLVSKMTGTANVTLSVSKISEVPIPMVSPRTQKWICDFCETCDQIEISFHEEENIKAKLLKTLVA